MSAASFLIASNKEYPSNPLTPVIRILLCSFKVETVFTSLGESASVGRPPLANSSAVASSVMGGTL
jgi:hypothetical protein